MADVKPNPLEPSTFEEGDSLPISTRSIGIQNADICDGIPLWSFGAAGISYANGKAYQLINANPTILLTRYNANVAASFTFGMCGPAYAFDMNAQGTLTTVSDPVQGIGQQLSLDLSDSNTSAGFFIGDMAQVALDFGAQIEVPELTGSTWHKHISLDWVSLFNFQIPISFSFLSLLVDLLQTLLSDSDNLEEGSDEALDQTIADKAKALGIGTAVNTASSLSMYAATSNDSLASSGQNTIEPTLSFNVNILPYILDSFPPFAEFYKAVQKIGITLGFGPVFQLRLPVAVELNEVYVNQETFSSFSLSDGTISATRYSDTLIAEIDSVALGVQHTPGFDFLAGVYFHFTWLKFLNLAPNILFNVTDLLGLDITTASQQHIVDDQGKLDPFTPSGVEILFEEPVHEHH